MNTTLSYTTHRIVHLISLTFFAVAAFAAPVFADSSPEQKPKERFYQQAYLPPQGMSVEEFRNIISDLYAFDFNEEHERCPEFKIQGNEILVSQYELAHQSLAGLLAQLKGDFSQTPHSADDMTAIFTVDVKDDIINVQQWYDFSVFFDGFQSMINPDRDTCRFSSWGNKLLLRGSSYRIECTKEAVDLFNSRKEERFYLTEQESSVHTEDSFTRKIFCIPIPPGESPCLYYLLAASPLNLNVEQIALVENRIYVVASGSVLPVIDNAKNALAKARKGERAKIALPDNFKEPGKFIAYFLPIPESVDSIMLTEIIDDRERQFDMWTLGDMNPRWPPVLIVRVEEKDEQKLLALYDHLVQDVWKEKVDSEGKIVRTYYFEYGQRYTQEKARRWIKTACLFTPELRDLPQGAPSWRCITEPLMNYTDRIEARLMPSQHQALRKWYIQIQYGLIQPLPDNPEEYSTQIYLLNNDEIIPWEKKTQKVIEKIVKSFAPHTWQDELHPNNKGLIAVYNDPIIVFQTARVHKQIRKIYPVKKPDVDNFYDVKFDYKMRSEGRQMRLEGGFF